MQSSLDMQRSKHVLFEPLEIEARQDNFQHLQNELRSVRAIAEALHVMCRHSKNPTVLGLSKLLLEHLGYADHEVEELGFLVDRLEPAQRTN